MALCRIAAYYAKTLEILSDDRKYPKAIINTIYDTFDDSFYIPKCLQQIEIPNILHMCATI